ncbi:hypothetical protein EVAR_53954_1 [Eumeta japonica]|uniref:Uncharacterized protein n=1 Tax=Eumeta variegata TaxID=151549 RepID=A0A4C1Y1V5_EUMVA|nr:hypothetical protein EVAR_53954_1 [Eumeta japonica]
MNDGHRAAPASDIPDSSSTTRQLLAQRGAGGGAGGRIPAPVTFPVPFSFQFQNSTRTECTSGRGRLIKGWNRIGRRFDVPLRMRRNVSLCSICLLATCDELTLRGEFSRIAVWYVQPKHQTPLSVALNYVINTICVNDDRLIRITSLENL